MKMTESTIVCLNCNTDDVLVEMWAKFNEDPEKFHYPQIAMGYEVKSRLENGTPYKAFCLKCNDYVTYNYEIVGGCFQ